MPSFVTSDLKGSGVCLMVLAHVVEAVCNRRCSLSLFILSKTFQLSAALEQTARNVKL